MFHTFCGQICYKIVYETLLLRISNIIYNSRIRRDRCWNVSNLGLRRKEEKINKGEKVLKRVWWKRPLLGIENILKKTDME